MKPIKIDIKNADAIMIALENVNGKSNAHTYSMYYDIKHIMENAEFKLLKLISKKNIVGARCWSTSGIPVPNAYKYQRIGTTVCIERRLAGWYLIEIKPAALYKEGGGNDHLMLTKNQDVEAVARFKKQYSIYDCNN